MAILTNGLISSLTILCKLGPVPPYGRLTKVCRDRILFGREHLEVSQRVTSCLLAIVIGHKIHIFVPKFGQNSKKFLKVSFWGGSPV